MSQDYNISGYLNVQVPFEEIDRDFWENSLLATLTSPEKVMNEGVDSVSFLRSHFEDVGIYSDQSEENEFDDEEIEAGVCAIVEVTRFEFELNKSLSGCSIEDYLANVGKTLYQIALSKVIRISFSADHTYLNRGPDDTIAFTWAEMVKEFARPPKPTTIHSERRFSTMDSYEILLQQCAQNLIDEVTFKRFLEAYRTFWIRCRRGKIHPLQLNQAMKNIHRYAAKLGKSLTFNEGGYEMVDHSVPCGLDQQKDTLTGSNRSHHAPDYSELVHLLKLSLAMFDRFAARAGDEAGKSEEMLYLATRIRRHLTGAERMIRARNALQERYDPFKTEPQRDREIDELLRFYRHLWNFAEETEWKDREKADYQIVCMIGDIVPPFSEHGITEDKIGEYLHEKADWLEQNNIISFKKWDEVAQETLIHYLHDPDKWCREEPC